MPCTHCGENPVVGEYTLRFSPERRAPASVELELCEGCLETILAESDAELVDPALVATDETSVEAPK